MGLLIVELFMYILSSKPDKLHNAGTHRLSGAYKGHTRSVINPDGHRARNDRTINRVIAHRGRTQNSDPLWQNSNETYPSGRLSEVSVVVIDCNGDFLNDNGRTLYDFGLGNAIDNDD
jgi:hypothetical protein